MVHWVGVGVIDPDVIANVVQIHIVARIALVSATEVENVAVAILIHTES